MSTEGRLGPKKLRRIEALTGIKAVAGWAWHPVWEFRDLADRHYVLDTRTGDFQPHEAVIHYTSCRGFNP